MGANRYKGQKREALDSKKELSIPDEVVIEILSWLPFKPLQRFKCVSKAWLRIITTDSYFSQLHKDRGKTIVWATWSGVLLQQLAAIQKMLANFEMEQTGGIDNPCSTFRKGVDVIQHAPHLTGTTTTFCFDILQELDFGRIEGLTLVLAPTRKRAQPIEKAMRALVDNLQVEVHACVGGSGTSVYLDRHTFSSGAHVVVGTPHHVIHMLPRIHLPGCIKMFLVAEANEMVSRGYKNQISDIFLHLPPKVEVGGVFSETIQVPARKKLAPMDGIRKSKIKEYRQDFNKRNKRSSISRNQHLKMHL